VLDIVDRPRAAARIGGGEKITINLDPLVSESVHADCIRTAMRNRSERDAAVTCQSVARERVERSPRRYGRFDLEARREAGTTPDIRVLGLARIAADVSPELARETIAFIEIMGSLQASPAVEAAPADRPR